MSQSESLYHSHDLSLAPSPRGAEDGSVDLDSDGDTPVQHMYQKNDDGQQTFVNFLGQLLAQPHTRNVQQMLSFGQQGQQQDQHLQKRSTCPEKQPQEQLQPP
eukprot:CAMPEP_0178394166 /NCGR_PEP_ID=MMETSP0689_2-20121128/12562_1 /TAXON_ID=160604 /ORGANISM="Amphidinium massartii, Strain CS-259" /LENGTH=102 /DNA_ID=CAMNT_0020014779 /DNA_START=90 /DNA_END=394 /DNA_ORIENTATION=-